MTKAVDNATFETIVRETHPALRAYIAGMGISPHEVDDLAQEVYLELYKGFDRMPEIAPLRWLKGIARNLCLNHIRKVSRRGRLHQQALCEILARTQTNAEETFEDGSLSKAFGHCFENLPEKSRRLLKLRYEDDLTSPKIADLLEATAESIRVSLFRIRAQLKDCISSSLARERWR
jgi:RNA polymerase sigma-70 factor (ECF subfamily)